MSGLQLALGERTLAAFVMALARTTGFILLAPPFNTRSVPARVRAGIAIALALPLTSVMAAPPASGTGTAAAGPPDLTSTDLVLQGLMQLALGAVLGYFVLAAMSTVQAVGDLLDLAGGFNQSTAIDPLMLVQASVMGRLHQMVTAVLLFATGGHLMVLQGLARSVAAMPAANPNWSDVAQAVTADLAALFAGAVQIAAPVIGAMLIADVALGLLTRAAPAINAFSLSFPLKIMFTLLLAGLVIAQLPGILHDLVTRAVLISLNVVGAG